MKLTKRGQINFITMTIILLAGFMATSVVIVKLTADAKPKQLETMCYDSVLARGKLQQNYWGPGGIDPSIKPFPLICKTIDKEIKGNKLKVMKEISDSLARCWQIFNEGKVPCIFENAMAVDACEPKCFKCYNLLIREGLFSEGESIDISKDLLHYLANNKYKKIDTTYGKYIKLGVAEALKSKPITSDSAYSVVFLQGTGNKQPKGGTFETVGGSSDASRVVIGEVDDKINDKIPFSECRTS